MGDEAGDKYEDRIQFTDWYVYGLCMSVWTVRHITEKFSGGYSGRQW